ncbi:FAD-binding oxidoreductase [Nocardia sp. BMG51109]|uniref:FAD-binding oxidoreductase n=1 Tax=Nocardia sp. BMG51109 TaxID=1056816 RepID=UPI000464741E|nr:FAD-binding oxidoreductase [Nocardia sp. BMG51109]
MTVAPSDPRYQDLVHRGHPRFVASPDYVRIVGSTEQVIDAVNEAVQAGKRIAVRGGGHCLDDFVDTPDIQVIIDLSGMSSVDFDPEHNAFVAEGGALLEEVYRRLFLGWNVTIPGGWCPKVGVGGHIPGGGYGTLSRLHGLAADHLYAVEVVVVGLNGRARAVVATRDPADPNRDLWWAHTGAGGGNFGIVTRYWFRSPGVTASDPSRLLPTPPASVLDFSCEWSWDGMDEQRFITFVRNHGEWCERNNAADAPASRYYAELILVRKPFGKHVLIGQTSGPDAERLLDEHLAALGAQVAPPSSVTKTPRPWLASVYAGPDNTKNYRLKIKSGFLTRPFTDEQSATIFHQLVRDDYPGIGGSLGIATFGGAINTPAPGATATVHRGAIARLLYSAPWLDPAEDALHLAWIRDFYREVYAATGGVPDPADGAYINYPDSDLADPNENASGVPWHRLYFGDNYARLQRVKHRFDPLNIFRHALSVRADAAHG